MHLPEFDRNKMEWDSWRAFHVTVEHYSAFVQFDTGELIVTNRRWSPDERRAYKELHLQVIGTDDRDCPRLFVPGSDKPVPKSHLNHNGMQVLLLDHDCQRAVSLESWMTGDNNGRTIPERFRDRGSRNVNAYYSGPSAMPLGAVPITRHYPQPLTTKERAHVAELHEACKVWLQMQGDPKALMQKHRSLDAPKVATFVDVSFAVLTEEHRTAIAVKGFDMIKREENNWLTFKTWFEFNKQDDE